MVDGKVAFEVPLPDVAQVRGSLVYPVAHHVAMTPYACEWTSITSSTWNMVRHVHVIWRNCRPNDCRQQPLALAVVSPAACPHHAPQL